MTIYLSKKQALDADPKKIQQISFTWYLDLNAANFFIIKESKEIILDFLQRTVKVF